MVLAPEVFYNNNYFAFTTNWLWNEVQTLKIKLSELSKNNEPFHSFIVIVSILDSDSDSIICPTRGIVLNPSFITVSPL